MEGFSAVILAAGMGTRMKSRQPKVLHKLCGKHLAAYVADAAQEAGCGQIITVVGHCADEVKAALGDKMEYALQEQMLGTGHAVMQAISMVKGKYTFVFNGDAPLLRPETVKAAIEAHEVAGNSATVITAVLPDASGYGRIVRNADGEVTGIVEQKDASEEELKIREVNSGMYVFNTDELREALGKITPDNAQKEYYLTDTIGIIRNSGGKTGAFAAQDPDEIRGINDRAQLAEVERLMQMRINRKHMMNGVTIHAPETVLISPDVVIGADSEIYPQVILEKGTVIGSGVTIGSGSRLSGAVIRDFVDIQSSVILDSEVCENTHVGPFAYIRPNCVVGSDVKVGDFVELKNANIGNGTKISHLTYVGDADVGEKCNFGCGTVTVNYDGKKKYRTTIGNNAFIGCNSNLVAPVTLKDGAYTAAGSTITDEVPENTLAIARARQVNKEVWNDRRKK